MREALRKYLIPDIHKRELLPLMKVALASALVMGFYGLIHNQISYSLSPEYFTQVKFKQFHYLDFGLGDRIFAACIGFVASSGAGLVVGWLLARRYLRNRSIDLACKNIKLGFIIVWVMAVSFAVLTGLYTAQVRPDYAVWADMIQRYAISDPRSFIQVAYMHIASYSGGLMGVLVTLLLVK